MEENKAQNTFLIIISIATLIIAIIGTSFAWFGILSNSDKEKEDESINKSIIASVIYENDSKFNLTNNDLLVKKFKISQTDKESKEIIKYIIKLNIDTNTIVPDDLKSLSYDLNSTGNINGGTLISKTKSNLPNKDIVIGTGEIVGYETHEYELKFNLNDKILSGDYSGNISIELIENQK